MRPGGQGASAAKPKFGNRRAERGIIYRLYKTRKLLLVLPSMSPKENPDAPAGYLVEEILADEKGVVTLWRSPDRKKRLWTFEGKIRKEISRFARRRGITFDLAARVLAETVFAWMKNYRRYTRRR